MAAYSFPNDAIPVGSAAYYLIRFAPPATRQNLAVSYAWFKQLEGLIEVSDIGVAFTKLRWWQEEVERIFAGRPTHPLGIALSDMLSNTDVEPGLFLEIAEAINQHLAAPAYHDAGALHSHFCATWGNLTRLFARIRQNREFSKEELQQCGAYFGMVDSLRCLGGELTRSCPRVMEPDILALTQMGQDSKSNHISKMCEHLAQYRPDQSFGRGTFSAMLALSDARLKEIQRSGSTVVTSELDLTPLRTLWIVWRA